MLKTELEENRLKLEAETKEGKISYIFKKGNKIIDKNEAGGKEILLSWETIKLLFGGSAAATLAICYNGGKTHIACPVCEKEDLFVHGYIFLCKNCSTKFVGLQDYMKRDLI